MIGKLAPQPQPFATAEMHIDDARREEIENQELRREQTCDHRELRM
jgi:hypothetical protein